MTSGLRRARGGQALVLLAAVLWGTTGTAQQFAPVGATPLTVGALRLFLGGAVLWLVVQGRTIARRRRYGASEHGPRLRWHPGLLGAAIGVAGFQVAFFSGVIRTGVAVGTLVAIGSAPVWAGLLEALLLGRKPGASWAAATATAIIGSTLLIGVGSGFSTEPTGVLLTLAAGAAFALYIVANKTVLHEFPGEEDRIGAAALFGGGLLLVPILILGDLGWFWHPRGLAVVLHLSLVATAAPYSLFGRGLATVSAASATTLTLAEPLTAALLGVVVLGERLGVVGIAGGLLVLLSLLLVAKERGA